jgi:hypothetical protein
MQVTGIFTRTYIGVDARERSLIDALRGHMNALVADGRAFVTKPLYSRSVGKQGVADVHEQFYAVAIADPELCQIGELTYFPAVEDTYVKTFDRRYKSLYLNFYERLE